MVGSEGNVCLLKTRNEDGIQCKDLICVKCHHYQSKQYGSQWNILLTPCYRWINFKSHPPSLYQTLVLFTCLILIVGHCYAENHVFTNTWAVHIEGGEAEANRIARKHGFNNLGKIFSSSEEDDEGSSYYHFSHQHVHKRSAESSQHHHANLIQESTVRWAEQQRSKRRVKRDLLEEAEGPGGPGHPGSPPGRPQPLVFTDQGWQDQWYLNRGAGLDMNVAEAWRLGYTGRGVVVTILDDGIEYTHPDLHYNYDPLAGYDVNDKDPDPIPRYDYTNENK